MSLFKLKILGGVGAAAGTSLIVGVAAIKKEKKFIDSEIGRKVIEKFEKIKNQTDCKTAKGEWVEEKCVVPKTIKEEIIIDSKKIELPGITDNNKKDECFLRKNGYYKGNVCYEPGIVVRPRFEKWVKDWDQKEYSDPGEGESLNYMDKEKFMKAKKSPKDEWVFIFSKDKILENKMNNWDFPNHFLFVEPKEEDKKGKGVAIEDVCKWLDRTDSAKNKKKYLYNENKGTWWDCQHEKTIFFVSN